MWALRRASLPLRNRGLRIQGFTASLRDLDQPSRAHSGVSEYPYICPCSKGHYCRKHASLNLFISSHGFSSRAGASKSKAGEEDSDSERGESSDNEITDKKKAVRESGSEDGSEDEDLCEVDLDDGETSKTEFEILDADVDLVQKSPTKKRISIALVDEMIASQGLSIKDVLKKWVEEGKKLDRPLIYTAMLNLRRLRMYGRALQFSEWLEESKHIEFTERDYASHVDLISKVRGLRAAEMYVDRISKPFRGEFVYRTLLANWVQADNLVKAEEMFNKMKDLEFPVSVFTCNQLLLLYKRVDKKKIPDVLLLMEKENLKPSLFTYKILIDTKGRSNDIEGMEAILKTMKTEGIEEDMHVKSIVAGHYVYAGMREKAEALLKDMEGGNLKENRQITGKLLGLYAELGQADEVRRVWNHCKANNPRGREFLSAVTAFGKLNDIEQAETIFEEMLNNVRSNPTSLHYNSLLQVYADNKMLEKGKNLAKRMIGSGCRVGALAWDSLVRLFVESGELEKAEAVLKRASKENLSRPILFRSYMTLMDRYSKKGDIHNTEKVFLMMRQVGYRARFNQFRSLVMAYMNAKSPAYGMRERMKADNIFPNKDMVGMLARVDAFRKVEEMDFLD